MNEHIGSGSDALFEYTFNEYQKCARLLISDENQGRDELIKILEKKNDYSRILDGVLADLIESAGFYPYIIKNDLTPSSSSQKIRFENNRSINIKDKVFHDEQKYLLDLINSEKKRYCKCSYKFWEESLNRGNSSIQEIQKHHYYSANSSFTR